VPRSLLALLAVLGAVLTLSVVPGVFTIDEDNYLVTVTALRHGRLTVPGTEGLPPARELAWFDPNGAARAVTETPVASTAPPLYAPLALPFSLLGWRGLVALNTLCFLLATAAVFLLTRRHARHGESAWIAAVTFAAGGYALEYAQGVWPHMLTAALCTGAVLASTRTRDEPDAAGAPAAWAFAAGALVGLAAGVRYQNFLFAGCLGLGILLFASRRWRCSLTYALGVAVPLGASSLLNHARLGFWNPISKGGTYLSSLGGTVRSQGWIGDAVTMGWARIVDYGTRPPLTGTEHAVYLREDAATGAYLVAGAVKKAWLQSSPWLALALLALVLAWLPSRGGPPGGKPDPRRRELRVLALIVLPILAMFSASGVLRTDGLSFNQRYFLELVPLAAVAFAWLLDGSGLLDRTGTDAGGGRRRFGLLALGAVLGTSLAAATLLRPAPSPIRLNGLLHLPLALAVLALLGWAICRRSRHCGTLALAVGACLGWSLAVHVGDDMAASRAIRRQNARLAAVLDPVLTDRSAYLAYWGAKDAVGPLLLDRDLVVLDVRNAGGRNTPSLVAALRARGWRVVALPAGFPPAVREALAADWAARLLRPPPVPLVELVAREPTPGATGPAPP
jgi:hypothetical protein